MEEGKNLRMKKRSSIPSHTLIIAIHNHNKHSKLACSGTSSVSIDGNFLVAVNAKLYCNKLHDHTVKTILTIARDFRAFKIKIISLNIACYKEKNGKRNKQAKFNEVAISPKSFILKKKRRNEQYSSA